MNSINVISIVLLLIILIIYINYSNRYSSFLQNISDHHSMYSKIYSIKKEYGIKRNTINLCDKLINMDKLYYTNIMKKIDINYNNLLKAINIEIEKLKNLNKEYETQINSIQSFDELSLLKSKYNKNIKLINNEGYQTLINIEKYENKLLQSLYDFYLTNENTTHNYKKDIDSILLLHNININLYKHKLKSILKKSENTNNCNLRINWRDSNPTLKCCEIKK